jgi:hypothetical protein
MKSEEYQLQEPLKAAKLAGWIGLAALLLCGLGMLQNPAQFYHSWLAALFFGLSIALGALFLTMVLHLTGAAWSTPVRRLLENLAATLPLLSLLFLPILFGLHDLYHWSHVDEVAKDPLLQQKSLFLNTPFFIIRALLYLAVWSFLALRLRSLSLAQDDGTSVDVVAKMRKLSAGGMILFAITLTFAAFDWLMSLDAHWYSTIFGVYVFAGCVVAGLAGVILLALYLQRQGYLHTTIGLLQYNDLGKLLFVFTVFWAYMAVSQYFLIWYGNIPEETIWYRHRWIGSWKTVSLLLVFGHFLVPFVVLLTRWAKRNQTILAFFSAWLLLMHWIDLQWLVMPTLHSEGFHLSWMDGTVLAGVVGVLIWYAGFLLGKHALAPVNDPHLQEAIDLNH